MLLCSCGGTGWSVGPVNAHTISARASKTPVIDTATPPTLASSQTPVAGTPVLSNDSTSAASPSKVSTPDTDSETTPTTATALPASHLVARILGCDAGFESSHGSVTVESAYVQLRNDGLTDSGPLCVTLNGLVEGQPNPDKTKCFSDLPQGYAITLKLAIDAPRAVDTPIQVEVRSGEELLLRLGEAACPAPAVPPEAMSGLYTPQPMP